LEISIIVPCLNDTPKLIECLELLTSQTYNAFEIIAIDGGSYDTNKDDFDVLERVNFISEPDLGIYDAMNKGISLSQGNWIYFMGVDDCFYDFDVLKSLVPYFDKKDVKLILGQIVYIFRKQDSVFLKNNKGLVKPIWSKKIWFKNTLPHQGIFYHKSVFYQKRYDIRYKILADYAFNLNLWKQKTSVLTLEKIITKCGTEGVSKKYNYTLYKEDVILKTRASSIFFMPFFVVLNITKFILKKIF
jgi:putative colanic acid biosynthesis glycosyltransferase